MRLHVPSLPWTETTGDYLSCAYTQKVVKFCQMMDSLGHEVVLYAGERNEAPCAEYHVVVSDEERRAWFGEGDSLGVSMSSTITWEPQSVPWRTMNTRVAAMLGDADPREELFCPISGYCQWSIAERWPALSVAEWGIGYKGIGLRERWARCFESYAWMHHVYGRERLDAPPAHDVVIPNSFDPDDFRFSPDSDGYVLFLGRVTGQKNPHWGSVIAEQLDMPYLVAGPGAMQDGELVVNSAEGFGFRGQYVGCADKERRRELLSRAALLIVPTAYIEPFGGVAVEAMLSGTPVLATRWGAFPETVAPGVSGELFSNVAEGTQAAERAIALDRVGVRAWAERYSIWNVRFEYDQWLKSLL